MVLHVTPAQASGLVIWLSHRPDRRPLLLLLDLRCDGPPRVNSADLLDRWVTFSLAGYWHDRFLGGFSVFYLMIMVQQFFGSGSYSIIGPYMAEIWPARLRASGWGSLMALVISANSLDRRGSR